MDIEATDCYIWIKDIRIGKKILQDCAGIVFISIYFSSRCCFQRWNWKICTTVTQCFLKIAIRFFFFFFFLFFLFSFFLNIKNQFKSSSYRTFAYTPPLSLSLLIQRTRNYTLGIIVTVRLASMAMINSTSIIKIHCFFFRFRKFLRYTFIHLLNIQLHATLTPFTGKSSYANKKVETPKLIIRKWKF